MDCRVALPFIPDAVVDCIITSPPYGSLKDYGRKKQIGYGQKLHNEYLRDIESVLVELYRVAKKGAALWVVLDTLRISGETVVLPLEVTNLAKKSGWTVQDILVWDKGKSLPWSHRGRFRAVCEFILLFGKGPLKTFSVDSVRDVNSLADYWVKYPERYRPGGKAPSDLWHFPIPTQGSWGNGQLRHVCPFPIGLVRQMVEITTKSGNVVLDPFSGSGVVPVVSGALGRFGLGFEINSDFVRLLKRGGHAEIVTQVRKNGDWHTNDLSKTIVQLRLLKFAKVLFKQLSRSDQLGAEARKFVRGFVLSNIKIEEGVQKEENYPVYGTATLYVLAESGAPLPAIEKAIEYVIGVPPLSKFSVTLSVRVVSARQWGREQFHKRFGSRKMFSYENGKFYQHKNSMTPSRMIKSVMDHESKPSLKYPTMWAPIEMQLTTFD